MHRRTIQSFTLARHCIFLRRLCSTLARQQFYLRWLSGISPRYHRMQPCWRTPRAKRNVWMTLAVIKSLPGYSLLGIFILKNISIPWAYQAEIFSKTNFALNPATCPSGQPRDTEEESAAHRLLASRKENTPRNHF